MFFFFKEKVIKKDCLWHQFQFGSGSHEIYITLSSNIQFSAILIFKNRDYFMLILFNEPEDTTADSGPQ